ncbi:hypothetical protein EI94DRAFT_814193 [Lactarius quietus]|nr:hypothetical protein EI94DRAFT_814193 [Lactarius quietus]
MVSHDNQDQRSSLDHSLGNSDRAKPTPAKTVTDTNPMNPNQASSWEHLQQAIDSEIKSLEGSIKALKHRRNALAPVSSLPPEVFTAIFSYLCLPENPDHRRTRLRVSHVCHQWREIVLNQTSLWNHLDFTDLNAEGITEALVRAKSAPLYFEASFPWNISGRGETFLYRNFQKELPAHIPRICHLNISVEPFLLYGTLKRLVSPAPTLEYLSLEAQVDYMGRRGKPCPIPDTLFDGATPGLSRLKLRNCNIS